MTPPYEMPAAELAGLSAKLAHMAFPARVIILDRNTDTDTGVTVIGGLPPLVLQVSERGGFVVPFEFNANLMLQSLEITSKDMVSLATCVVGRQVQFDLTDAPAAAKAAVVACGPIEKVRVYVDQSTGEERLEINGTEIPLEAGNGLPNGEVPGPGGPARVPEQPDRGDGVAADGPAGATGPPGNGDPGLAG